MATLREALQTKIDAATAELDTLKADLVKFDASGWLDQEYEAIKAWFDSATKYLGL